MGIKFKGYLLVLFLMLSSLAHAQGGGPLPIVETGSAASGTPFVVDVNGEGAAGIQLSGTWTGTVVVTGTTDCTNYDPTAIKLFDPSASSVSSVTSNGLWFFSVAGLCKIQVDGVDTGSADVTLRALPITAANGASSGGGGGGGGTVDQGAAGAASWKVLVTSSTLPTGAATAAKQDTGNVSLASIDGKITAVNTGAVVVSSSALPAGASTAANQTSGNSSLTSIDGKLPATLAGGGGLKVECLSGCTPGGSFADASAFTYGSSAIGPVGYVVDDTSTNTVPEDSAGAPRMTTNRVAYADVSLSPSQPLPTGASTASAQSTGNASLASIDGKITTVNTGAVVVSSSALPTGAATESTLSTLNGKVTAVNTGAVVVSSSALPTGAATESTLSTLNGKIPASPATDRATAVAPFSTRLSDGAAFYKATTPSDTQPVSAAALPLPTGASTESTLSTLNGKVTAVDTGAVVVASSALPTGAATSSLQTTGNTSLSSIDGKLVTARTADYDSGAGTVTTEFMGIALPASGGPVAGGTATNPLQVSIANTGANATAVKVDGSAVTQPASIAGNVTVVQATGTNLHTVCDSGCTASVSPADEAAFSAGTTTFGLAGGFFQTTATNNALTTGQMGSFQVTANRALFTNLRNASGTELGVAAAPLQVSLANTASNATGVKVEQNSGANLHVVSDSGSVTTVSQSSAVNLNAQVVGPAGTGTNKSGNPVQTGAVFNTTQPTVLDGKIVEKPGDGAWRSHRGSWSRRLRCHRNCQRELHGSSA
jgi:hypothetical protein